MPAWVLILPWQATTLRFFLPPSHPGTEKVNKSPRKTKKTLIIPIFSKYFTITLVLSLETHLNSLSLYSSDLTEPNVTKLNINWLSAKTGILHFTKSFLTKKNIGRESLKTPGTFFLIPPFQNLGLKVAPAETQRRGERGWVLILWKYLGSRCLVYLISTVRPTFSLSTWGITKIFWVENSPFHILQTFLVLQNCKIIKKHVMI